MISTALNSPGYRLQELAASGPDDTVVEVYAGDVRDVCAESGKACPDLVTASMRPGEAVQMTIADVKSLLAPKPEPKTETTTKKTGK